MENLSTYATILVAFLLGFAAFAACYADRKMTQAIKLPRHKSAFDVLERRTRFHANN